MLCGNWWRPAAGWRTSDALNLPYVGDKAVSAEVQATLVREKNLCMTKTRYTDMERERERERQRERERDKRRYQYYVKNNNNQNTTTNSQPLQKVTKSLYIVISFILFTEIAQTWVVQRDSVNMAIIHSYSTCQPSTHQHESLDNRHLHQSPRSRQASTIHVRLGTNNP